MLLFLGDKMIAEEKKDLVNRREFYQAVTKKMGQKGGANLNTTLTLREVVEIFNEIPAHDELSAEWIYDTTAKSHICSWCRMIGNSYTRYCSYCGRRMRRKDSK